MSRENFAFFLFKVPALHVPFGRGYRQRKSGIPAPQSLPLPPYYLIVSTLMVLVLPGCPLICPPVRTTLSPFSRWQTRFAWCSA